MRFIPHGNLADVLVIDAQVFRDERGFFLEAYHAGRFAEAGITCQFVQDNHSGSKQHTLRGIHYQICHPQAKLVKVTVGEVYDVCVDLRKSSPTFGKFAGAVLSAENRQMLWIPKGYGHGFFVLSDWAEIIYKVDDFYTPECERTLLWNDPKLKIPWPIPDGVAPIISPKDALGKPLDEADLFD